METDPAFNLEYVLAEKIGCTVRELRRRMPMEEFVGWGVFLGRRAQARELTQLRARR
jgi:hypothetical protein